MSLGCTCSFSPLPVVRRTNKLIISNITRSLPMFGEDYFLVEVGAGAADHPVQSIVEPHEAHCQPYSPYYLGHRPLSQHDQ